MCGRFSTSRRGCLQFSSGLCPPARDFGHSPEDNWSPTREVENLPHIRRHSRENASPNLCRYQWMPSCPTFSEESSMSRATPCNDEKVWGRLETHPAKVFAITLRYRSSFCSLKYCSFHLKA